MYVYRDKDDCLHKNGFMVLEGVRTVNSNTESNPMIYDVHIIKIRGQSYVGSRGVGARVPTRCCGNYKTFQLYPIKR